MTIQNKYVYFIKDSQINDLTKEKIIRWRNMFIRENIYIDSCSIDLARDEYSDYSDAINIILKSTIEKSDVVFLLITENTHLDSQAMEHLKIAIECRKKIIGFVSEAIKNLNDYWLKFSLNSILPLQDDVILNQIKNIRNSTFPIQKDRDILDIS